MAILSGHNLARSFGAEDIFSGISVTIPHGARIALVGPNGAGKTTLLNLLAGLDTPTEGSVTSTRGLRIGVLPQEAEMALAGKGVLWDEMLTAFDDLLAQEARLNQLADELAANPDDADLLRAYGNTQHRFEEAEEISGEVSVQVGQVLILEDDRGLVNVNLPWMWVIDGEVYTAKDLFDGEPFGTGDEASIKSLMVELEEESHTVTVYFAYELNVEGTRATAVIPFNIKS